jgi:hypothetical protein
MKRGLTYLEAIDYVGVKRRTFDIRWRPHLAAMAQGTSLIFDREDLDKLFDRFKAISADGSEGAARGSTAQNSGRNGRPIVEKGVKEWAERQPGSTPEKTEPGRSTSGIAALDFASAASRV